MNHFQTYFRKYKIWFFLILLVIPSFFTLLRPGFFPMQDDQQAYRIYQMDKCFQDFQIPCRWVPDGGLKYGYPQFIYYPPSVYYLGEFIHLLGFQYIDAVKILFILGFLLSAITMFILLKSLLGELPALVGAVLYTYAPYRAVDVYVRGAMSEFWAFVFFPLIFWSAYQLIKTSRTKYLIWLAVSIGLLLLTHNLMSMIFLPLVVVWALTWIVLNKSWKVIPKLVMGGVLGVGLAAFFTLPVIIEKPYAHIESMIGGYFDYRQHFVDINQLFISNYWGYGSSYLGPGDDLSLSTGQIHFAGALLVIILATIFLKKHKKIAVISYILIILDLIELFLTHQKSSFIWEKIEIFSYLQFPWRILALSVFLLSFLDAILVFLIPKKRYAVALGIFLVIITFVFYGNFFRPKEWLNITDKEKFAGKSWEKQMTSSIFDYLPIYAKLPPTSVAPSKPEVLEGQANIISYQKGSDNQSGSVQVVSKSKLRLPLFDFPGMQVKVDGKVILHQHDDCRGEEFCLGLINFNLPEGNHVIETRLGNTVVRSLGNIITLGSLGILGMLIFRSRKA